MSKPTHHHTPVHNNHYYVPDQSPWPIVGAIGLCLFVIGIVHAIQHPDWLPGWGIFALGVVVILTMITGWFNHVIRESMGGLYSPQMDRSFRWGMTWFIFSEIMFFMAFFGALFYAREIALPWLGGEGERYLTRELLWPQFQPTWPLLVNPSASIPGPHEVISPMGIPLLNTLILLTSGATITWAHWGLKMNRTGTLVVGLTATVLLGLTFLSFQIYEYWHAYHELGLTLGSGIYGSTFFMLTGFHGLHVTLGTLMLIVILFRSMKGHFSPDHQFAFEATSWYWHFVDVVWLGLFIFVYVL